jgi:hypothetical protein
MSANPNVRRDGETQKQFQARRRSENGKAPRGWLLWDAMKNGTYIGKRIRAKHKNFAQGQFPKLKPQPDTANEKNNKFKGFRKVRGIHAMSGISIWVHAS